MKIRSTDDARLGAGSSFDKWTKHLRTTAADFGAGVNFPFLKLFGNIKLGDSRERGVEEYELSFVSELVDLMNRVFRECDRLLKKHQNGRQFVIVLEDFENGSFGF